MSNAFTVDALRRETIRRYAPVEIELSDGTEIELKAYLKLKQNDRKTVNETIQEVNSIEEVEDDDDDSAQEARAELVTDATSRVFKLITSKHKKLLADLDHEDPVIRAELHTSVLTHWINGGQLGEAVSSPS